MPCHTAVCIEYPIAKINTVHVYRRHDHMGEIRAMVRLKIDRLTSSKGFNIASTSEDPSKSECLKASLVRAASRFESKVRVFDPTACIPHESIGVYTLRRIRNRHAATFDVMEHDITAFSISSGLLNAFGDDFVKARPAPLDGMGTLASVVRSKSTSSELYVINASSVRAAESRKVVTAAEFWLDSNISWMHCVSAAPFLQCAAMFLASHTILGSSISQQVLASGVYQVPHAAAGVIRSNM